MATEKDLRAWVKAWSGPSGEPTVVFEGFWAQIKQAQREQALYDPPTIDVPYEEVRPKQLPPATQ